MAADVVIERGRRRVFARAIDWPGWTRSARDEAEVLDVLVQYAPRYARVAGRPFKRPKDASGLHVVERTDGDATTDFGAPSIETKADRRPIDPTVLKRLVGLLKACWDAFDAAADAAEGVPLTTGPRGGGRSVEKMRRHVLEADRAYLAQLGGKVAKDASIGAVRDAMTQMLAQRARGVEPELSPRRKSPLWSPRFTVNRSAWHALDHAWEIEDRTSR